MFIQNGFFKKESTIIEDPIYEPLKQILNVDNDLDTLTCIRKGYLKSRAIHELQEYLTNFSPTQEFLNKLTDRGIDVFTFVERKWCCPLNDQPKGWTKTKKDIGILKVSPYDELASDCRKKDTKHDSKSRKKRHKN